MLLILFSAIILFGLVFKILGSRITIPRKYLIEGIEPPGVVEAFSFASQLPPFKLIRLRIAQELRQCNPQGVLVDVGCGNGSLLRLLAKQFPTLQLLGIDISQDMIATAIYQSRMSKLTDRIRFQQGDIHKLPLPNNSVHTLVSSLSLHHWSNPPQAMVEIHRVLLPKGQFVIFDFRRDSIGLIFWLIRFITRFIAPKPLRMIQEPLGSLLAAYTHKEVRPFFRNIPFLQVHVKQELAWLFIRGQKGNSD